MSPAPSTLAAIANALAHGNAPLGAAGIISERKVDLMSATSRILMAASIGFGFFASIPVTDGYESKMSFFLNSFILSGISIAIAYYSGANKKR